MAKILNIALICLLSIWLLLSILRQCFDLIGKLWALVLFDLFQVLALCSAIFILAHSSRSNCNLALLGLFMILSLAFNIALFFWWCTELLSDGDPKENVLTFGLPFGHSFFLRHSPFCTAHFNLTIHRWEQSSDCAFPYSYFEGIQPIIHAFLAAISFLLILSMVIGRHLSELGDDDELKQTATIEDEGILAKFEKFETGRIEEILRSEGERTNSNSMNYSIYEGTRPTFNPPPPQVAFRTAPKPPIAPIPPIRRSMPRRKEPRKNDSTIGENGDSSDQACAEKNYSTLSTAECTSTLAWLHPIQQNNNNDDSGTPNEHSFRSSDLYSSGGAPQYRLYSPHYTRLNRNEQAGGKVRHSMRSFSAQNTDYPLNNPPVISRQSPSANSPRQNLLVSFDPKSSSGQPLQMRERRASSDEEPEGQLNDENGFGNLKVQQLNSQESIPSIDAPEPAASNGPNQGSKERPTSSMPIGFMPSASTVNLPHPPPSLFPDYSGSPSMYETFMGGQPQGSCTSFPIQQGALPRNSAVQLAAASAIRLSRQDLNLLEQTNGQKIDVNWEDENERPSAIFGLIV